MVLLPFELNRNPAPTASTAYTAMTPPSTTAVDLQDDYNLDDDDPISTAFPRPSSTSSVPWPGSTFIIRAISSGHVLTLQDGQVILASPGGRGSIHWACVENKGWLGFQNLASGMFLGYDKNWKICCAADRQREWENFCVRMTPEGGYVLLMTHWERLWHIGVKEEQGVQRLAKIGDGGKNGFVWEFIMV